MRALSFELLALLGRHSVRLALVASGLFWASSASAQQKDDPQLLFDSGLKNMLAGEYGIGCALIKRSLQLDPMPGTIFTLAECYAKAGKTASSVEMYDEFLAFYARLPPDERPRQQARADVSKKERARLMTTVPWLTVLLPDNAPKGVYVTMDEKPFSESLLGVAIAVDPGKHRFTTRAPGARMTEHEVDVLPEQRRTLTLNIVTEGGATQPDDSVIDVEPTEPIDDGTESNETRLSPWFYVAGGVGVAGLVTGGVTGLLLLDKQKTIFDQCDKVDGRWNCTKEGFDAIRQAQDVLAPVTTVALGVGGVGIVTATILWLTRDSDAPQNGADSGLSKAKPMIWVGPGPSVSVEGRF